MTQLVDSSAHSLHCARRLHAHKHPVGAIGIRNERHRDRRWVSQATKAERLLHALTERGLVERSQVTSHSDLEAHEFSRGSATAATAAEERLQALLRAHIPPSSAIAIAILAIRDEMQLRLLGILADALDDERLRIAAPEPLSHRPVDFLIVHLKLRKDAFPKRLTCLLPQLCGKLLNRLFRRGISRCIVRALGRADGRTRCPELSGVCHEKVFDTGLIVLQRRLEVLHRGADHPFVGSLSRN